MTSSHLHAVILAGGSGTRFWPLSRRSAPKQLIALLSDRTMLQETVARVAPLVPPDRVWIVTGREHKDEVDRQVRAIGGGGPVIVEPVGRNTGPAIAVAAHRLVERDPEAVMAVLPADHVVAKPEQFLRCVSRGEEIARRGFLVTIGLVPRRPETGYGYIKRGEPLQSSGSQGEGDGNLDVFRVERFVEKPDRKTAEHYISQGGYLWNGGMFIWRAATILEEIRAHAPALAQAAAEIATALRDGSDEGRVKELYERIEPVSIDYAVMEHTTRAAVIPIEMGWSDVGSWAALDDVAEHDERGNVVSGRVLDIDSERSILYAQDRLVATIGLQDMIVVDTPDATLVCRKDRAQDVRRVVDALERQRAQEHVVHKTVQRPWGTYTVLEEGDGYKIKRIVVNAGARLSLQSHHRRSEHWVVVAGTARVTREDRVYDVGTNESTFIPPQTKHRLENADPSIPLQIIEVQSGPYLGEDDIVRFDDDFGRK
ncbi:MAG: mannose-1-phosphate guanylyltransferase/mannose-6-phosphate isomerase [Nitrospirae bacterium]|nr:mannose-1-phosphate guanylyltransferase/mannose-6-phosphate isomerase [Nitrospirota bacterium]